MKFYKENQVIDYDLAIFGLGYESRSIFIAQKIAVNDSIAIGYCHHTDIFSYKENKKFFEEQHIPIIEVDDSDSNDCQLHQILSEALENKSLEDQLNVLIDITVMSRHRLSLIIWFFLTRLKNGSKITIAYSLSKFIAPPTVAPPVKEIGPIIDDLNGNLGDLGRPTALVVGLGYEQNKALGAVTFIDPDIVYAFIPLSKELDFEKEVLEKNSDLLSEIRDKTFKYHVHQPYSTYLDLKSFFLDLLKENRPIFLPLGPKVIAALATILGWELSPNLPVWRVSSKGCEEPFDRKPSHTINFTIEIEDQDNR